MISKFPARSSGRRCSAGTAVATTSFNRGVVRPYSAQHVEASGLDIIMRRLTTSERTMRQRRHSNEA